MMKRKTNLLGGTLLAAFAGAAALAIATPAAAQLAGGVVGGTGQVTGGVTTGAPGQMSGGTMGSTNAGAMGTLGGASAGASTDASAGAGMNAGVPSGRASVNTPQASLRAGGASAIAGVALNTITASPASLNDAAITNASGATLGTVSSVKPDASGKPSKVGVLLKGDGAGHVAWVDASRFHYVKANNSLTTYLSAAQMRAESDGANDSAAGNAGANGGHHSRAQKPGPVRNAHTNAQAQ